MTGGFARSAVSTLLLGLATITAGSPAVAAADHDHTTRHLLLISVDGLHAFDLQLWTSAHPDSELAKLRRVGITFTNATTHHPRTHSPALFRWLRVAHRRVRASFMTTPTRATSLRRVHDVRRCTRHGNGVRREPGQDRQRADSAVYQC